MKYSVASLAALILASTSAFAADLPSRRAPPVFAPPPPPLFSWTGFYLGGNAGYAFDNRRDYTLSDPTGVLNGAIGVNRPAFLSSKRSGFTGGGQVGYNYQFGAGPAGGFVLGVEADAQFTDIRNNASVTLANQSTSDFNYRTDFVGTVRGRLGYAFNNFLVYGTGGFAYGSVRDNLNFFNNGALFYAGGQDKLRGGYAYGGGLEYAIPTSSFLNVFHSSAVSLKAEFLHYDLGSNNLVVANVNPVAAAGTGYIEHTRYQGNLVRAGINFKFGSPVAPVVARY